MTRRLALLALDLLFLALSPILFVVLCIASRGFTKPKLRRGLWAKLGGGLTRREGSGPSFWVHAVSVGETLTALPLIEALRRRFPAWDLRVSVSTYTGFEVARSRLGATPVFYFPFDAPFIVNRFFRRLRPTAVILLELEVWPSFLLCASSRRIPALVANGRLTERSARRYALGRGLTRRLFNLVTSYGAQNDAYRERFLRLGVEPRKVEVLGNLKHDRVASISPSQAGELRARLGWKPGETWVLVGGSTHPGEERALCAIHARLSQADPRMRLVIAPRHVERLQGEEPERWGASGPVARWSRLKEPSTLPDALQPGSGILVVDTIGELEAFYAMADVVFVGGSLVPRGGHNLFEPARLAKAVLFGPSFENFREEAEALLEAKGALSVAGESELAAALARLAADPRERAELGLRALEVTRKLGGAVELHVEWIERQLRLYLGPEAC